MGVDDEMGHRLLRLTDERRIRRVVVDGPEGLAELILSDFMMPTMNGAELCTALCRDAALRHIPFVSMTAISEAVVRQACQDDAQPCPAAAPRGR